MWNISFLSPIDGALTTKKGPRAEHEKERITNLIKENVFSCGWKKLPRAKLAVRFRFFDTEQNKADITRLVKFYLDLLKGSIFDDDRQVYYLEAVTWRVKPSLKGPEKSSVTIQVRRLSDYIRLLDYAGEADSDFEEDDRYNRIVPNYSLEPHLRNIVEAQEKSISNLNISIYDRPGLKSYLQTMMSYMMGISPFIVDLGALPQDCGTNQFKKILQEKIAKFKKEVDFLSTIYVPIELDVQVTSPGLTLGKDLDNIMLLIGSAFRKELLNKPAYLSGYRIYVVEKSPAESDNTIMAQLLPKGAIQHYDNHFQKVLEQYEEKLEC